MEAIIKYGERGQGIEVVVVGEEEGGGGGGGGGAGEVGGEMGIKHTWQSIKFSILINCRKGVFFPYIRLTKVFITIT